MQPRNTNLEAYVLEIKITSTNNPIRCNVLQLFVADAGIVNSQIRTTLSPHDALKHHFTSLKTDLIFLQ